MITTINEFLNYLNEKKIYKYINLSDYNVYYNIPFELGINNICIDNDDKYSLCFYDAYVYDYITDEQIFNGLKSDLSNIDISTDWSNHTDNITAYEDNNLHTLRICKLINEINNNNKIKPIILEFSDNSFMHDIKNYISDGHHRIRALQYLKYDYYPAYIGGNFAKYLIKYLINNYKNVNNFNYDNNDK